MNKKYIFLSFITIICIGLLTIGLISNFGYIVSADDKTDKIKDKDYINFIRTNDSIEIIGDLTKEYIADEKEIIINDDGELLVDFKLLTSYKNRVSSNGKKPVARWLVIDYSDKWKLFDKIDSYVINDDYKVKDKDYILKYLVETEIENCYNNITLENKKFEECYNYTKKEWTVFDKVDDIPNKNIEIGLFATGLVEGEHIEFIPTIEGIKIYEYASYLVTDLTSYWNLDEISGTTVADSLETNDGSAQDATIFTTEVDGIINTGADFTTAYLINLTVDPITVGDFTISFWFNKSNSAVGNERLFYNKMYGATSFQITSATNGYNDSVWHFVVVTRENNNFILWIDGVSQGSSDTSGVNGFSVRWDDGSSKIHLKGQKSTTGANSQLGDWTSDAVIRMDEVGFWETALNSTEVTALYNNGDGFSYPFEAYCIFAGYVKDENENALVGANVTIWNQFDISEYYSNTTIAGGLWSLNISNSTNTYMVGAYYNNTLIGQLKPYVSGSC